MRTVWLRGRQTRIILINSGDETLSPVTVTAGGREYPVPPVESGASHRLTPGPGGPAAPVTVISGGHTWTGSWLTPGSGQRIILRLLPDGTVEEQHTLSPWLEWLGE